MQCYYNLNVDFSLKHTRLQGYSKKNRIIRSIRHFWENHTKHNLNEYTKKYYSETIINKYFGSWTNALKELGYPLQHKNFVTKEEFLEDVKKVINETGFTGRENYYLYGKYTSRSILKRLFGGWNNVLKELNIKINMHKPGQYTKEDIINDYLFLKEKYGRPLTAIEYRNKGNFSQPVIDSVFGDFQELRRVVGEKAYGLSVTETEIKEEVYSIYKQYGIITAELLNKEMNLISYPTLLNRYGSLKNFCKSINIPYDDNNTPNASKFSISCQNILNKLLENEPYESEKTFPWLKNPKTNRPLFIDSYYKSLSLAFEFDGMQHYKYCSKFHKNMEQFKENQERNKEKDKLLKKHGIDVIRIKKGTIKEITSLLESIV